MSLYGLSVFLETRDDLKNGRRLYVAISFVLTGLVAFNALLEALLAFRWLFESTSPLNYIELSNDDFLSWQRWGSTMSLTALVFIGNSMLVQDNITVRFGLIR